MASLVVCFLLATLYVLSLYFWSMQNRFGRNSPDVIRRRFISVILSCFISVGFIYFLALSTTALVHNNTTSWLYSLSFLVSPFTVSSHHPSIHHDNSSLLQQPKHSLLNWIGLRFDSTLPLAILYPLLLTMILFSGPLVQSLISGYLFEFQYRTSLAAIDLRLPPSAATAVLTSSSTQHQQQQQQAVYDSNNNSDGKELNGHSIPTPPTTTHQLNSNNSYASSPPSSSPSSSCHLFMLYLQEKVQNIFKLTTLKQNACNLITWRNYVISPFTEEFVFRSCMLPLLCVHFSLVQCVFLAPLFFGLAHLHHIIEGYKLKEAPLSMLVKQHLFQFVYTYIFGSYSCYLFLRTGNLFSSFAAHSFCNLMGFPNIVELLNDFEPRIRLRLILCYIFGLIVFSLLLTQVTKPQIYDNRVYMFL